MKTILFCGGGSAGHVIPNIALIEYLKDRYNCVYAGTKDIEMDICATNHVEFFEFDAVKLNRGKFLGNLAIPFRLLRSISECKKIVERVKPSLIFCKGGYVSLPVAIAGKRAGVPVITHESDVRAGLANKIIAKYCKKVFCTFESTAKTFRNGVFVGTPMRKGLFEKDRVQARRYFGLDMRPTILVFGGGGGSKIINSTLRQVVADVCKNFNVVHVCGKGNLVQSNIYGYKQVEFVDDMGLAYACCDVAVARCGSNSANELIALKTPTLFIPLENKSTRGDQVDNANYFLERKLCHVLRENCLNEQTLKNGIDELFGDKGLKTRLSTYRGRNANKRIFEEIERIIIK